MVAHSTRTKKSKGQQFQKKVVKILRNTYHFDNSVLSCFEGDIQANAMGQSGRDIKLSPKAEHKIPFDIECKRSERLSLWHWFNQATQNTKQGRIPLLIFQRNRSKIYCMLELKDLMDLIKNEN